MKVAKLFSISLICFYLVIISANFICASETIKIKGDMLENFGKNGDYIINKYGTPDIDTGDSDPFGRNIGYNDKFSFNYKPYSDIKEIEEISGNASYIFDGLASSYNVNEFMNSIDGFDNPTYYVDEERGDYANYGEGANVATVDNGEFVINITYENDIIDGNSYVDIWHNQTQENNSASTPNLIEIDAISVLLNGSKISFDQEPININGRIMVPIRPIFEAMGYSVEWNGETHTATATKGRDMIIVQTDDEIINYYINSSAGIYECDVPPQIVSGRILVPVRAISESAGCNVDWDADNCSVIIKS